MYNYFYLFLFLLYFQLLQNNTKNNKIILINMKNFNVLCSIMTNIRDKFAHNSLNIHSFFENIMPVEMGKCKRVFNSGDKIEMFNFIINK